MDWYSSEYGKAFYLVQNYRNACDSFKLLGKIFPLSEQVKVAIEFLKANGQEF
jgi:hypothetical protein